MATRDAWHLISRRAFLGRSALAASGAVLSLSALSRLGARSALAASGRSLQGSGYRPLAPVKPRNPAGSGMTVAISGPWSAGPL